MPPRHLDAIDRRILRHIQQQGKLSNVQLASLVGLSPSPCLARVRKLEDDGVIFQYTALVDPEALGLKISIFIQVALERQVEQALQAFEGRMRAYPEVMECYLMTGDSDYLLRVVVRDIAELQEFIVHKLSTISDVANIRSSFSLKQVKYNTALPVDS